MFAKVSKKDPYTNFSFRVHIDSPKLGAIQCGFHTVSGLGVNAVYKEYREGGNNFIPDKLLETVSDNPVSFATGMTDNEAIVHLGTMFFEQGHAVAPFSNRFDIRVEVMDRTLKKPVRTYGLYECVLETFILGDLNSMGSEFLIENFSVRFNAISIN